MGRSRNSAGRLPLIGSSMIYSIRYIRTQGEMPHFDVTSALRVCYSMGKTRALTVAYGALQQDGAVIWPRSGTVL